MIGHGFDRRRCLPTATCTLIEDTARRAQLSLPALPSKRSGHLTSRLAVAWSESCQKRSGMHTFMSTCRSHSIRTRGPMSPSQLISAFSPNCFACARHEPYPHTALTDGASKHLLTDAPRIKSLAGALRTVPAVLGGHRQTRRGRHLSAQCSTRPPPQCACSAHFHAARGEGRGVRPAPGTWDTQGLSRGAVLGLSGEVLRRRIWLHSSHPWGIRGAGARRRGRGGRGGEGVHREPPVGPL